jgi:glucose/arabinose dehydrogenase
MKRILLLLVVFLTACASLGTPLASTQTPGPVPETVAAPATDLPVSPTAVVGGTTKTPPASAAITNVTNFPDPTAFKWTKTVSGLVSPDDIQFPDDGTGRMFVIEQGGRILLIEKGQILAPAFLDIRDRVGNGGNEQGLLGLAFHPDFKDNPYFYVNYTDQNGNTVIARFQANGDTADPASEINLLHVDQPFPNHNGGETVFGPDGYLYLGLGDGGSADDPLGNGQNTNVLLGKILRIDVDHGDPFAIPADNPFSSAGGRPEIWAYGLRNPWRFSFDKKTGDLYIADVGQDLWEEVDASPGNPPGLDYGWNYSEGLHHFLGSPPASLKLIHPVAEYSHQGGRCSVTGGYVYRGAMPEWQGIYIYADFCTGTLWGLLHSPDPNSQTPWQSQVMFETHANITSFGQDPSGEIYFADRNGTINILGK